MDQATPPEGTSKFVPLDDIEMQETGRNKDDDGVDPVEELQRDAEYSEQTGQLWSNYVKLAEKRDKAVTSAWKDDMNGVIIFAGLYSAALTAFLVQSYQNLQEDPAETSAALLKQTVFLLAQISQQLAPNGSQVNISLPDPIPPFTAKSSSQRVNTLWFLSLVLSLSAVLGATIVQQWAGYLMQVFHKLDNPIECSRIRQFLYEGTATWKLNVVIETIPGLIHMALFLFFIGLADFLFSLDRIVASITSTLMLVTTTLYFMSTGLPLLSPQSPYQTPLSNILWWISRKARGGDEHRKSRLSTNMFDGRTQMAMTVSSGRSQRDARALRWFIESPMDDTEFSLFINSIPATVDSVRGQSIWNNVACMQTRPRGTPTTGIPMELDSHPLDDLAGRLSRFLQSCIDQSIQDETFRRQRAHAGINAVLSLMFAGGFTWDTLAARQWGAFLRSSTLTRTLLYLATVDTVSDSPHSDLDGTSAVRRICMSIITISKLLADKMFCERVGHAWSGLNSYGENISPASLQERLRTSMETLGKSSDLLQIKLTERLFGSKQSQSSEWKKDMKAAFTRSDFSRKAPEISVSKLLRVSYLMQEIDTLTQGLIRHIPGAATDVSNLLGASTVIPYGEPLVMTHLASPDRLFRILEMSWDFFLQNDVTSSSEHVLSAIPRSMLFSAKEGPISWLPIQYDLLLDLHNGGMIYGILLLSSAIQVTRPTTGEAQALYINTFDAITSNWMKHRNCESTHACLVDLLLRYDYFENGMPFCLFGSVVNLVGNVLSETSCSHRDTAREFIRKVEIPDMYMKQKIVDQCLRKLS
ncbi:hypothetical protein DENSPDRAFT_840757 [Dentipellis sp. KUC8613]|nr:hypothetical protein DENSPDRAFT_840757 [Dentipellis sp. KUC8613]